MLVEISPRVQRCWCSCCKPGLSQHNSCARLPSGQGRAGQSVQYGHSHRTHSSPSAVSQRSSCTQRHTQKAHVCWGAHAGQTHAATRRAQRCSTATSVRSVAWESEEWTRTELHIVIYWSVCLSFYLYVFLSFILSLCPSVCSVYRYMSVCMSLSRVVYHFICLSIILSVVLFYLSVLSFFLFFGLSVSLYLSLSIYLSVCQSVCLSVCQSFTLSICLSVCHSIYRSLWLSISLSSLFLLCSQNPFISCHLVCWGLVCWCLWLLLRGFGCNWITEHPILIHFACCSETQGYV